MKRVRVGQRPIASLAILVLFSVFVAYYRFHHPFVPAMLSSLGDALWEIFVTLALTAIAGGLGARLLPELEMPPVVGLALRAALGFGVLGIAALVVGSILGVNPWTAWGGAFLGIFLLRNAILRWWQDGRALPALWSGGGRLGRAIAALSALIFFVALIVALAPPLKFDALVYHLTLPLRYLQAGRVYYVEDLMVWGFPQLPHMLSTWALALGAGRGALLGWVMGLLCVLGFVGHLGERLGVRRGWVAVAALLAGSSLAASLGWGYVDWPSMLMGWAMLFALDRWSQNGKRAFLLLAGAFAGLAFGVKYSAGLLALLGLVYVSLQARSRWRAARVYLAMAFGFALPWLLKNVLATGNPFYPLLLAGGAMDAIRLRLFQNLSPQGSWLDLIFLPLRATFAGIEGGRVGDAPGYEASIGPLLLALGLFAWRRRGPLRAGARPLLQLLTLFGVGTLLIWAIGGRVSGHLIRTHLYYAAFPAFAGLGAYGFAALERMKLPGVRVGRVAAALVVLALAMSMFQASTRAIASGAVETLFGQRSPQDYLEHNLGLYALVAQSLREELPQAKVLMLWEPRSYYCLPVCEADEIIDRWAHDLEVQGDPQNVLASWRSQGYTHLLYYRLGAEFVAQEGQFYHPLDLAPLESLLDGLTLMVDFKRDYALYSLSP